MAGASEVFRGTAELHQNHDFVDHLARAESDDMPSKYAIGGRVGQDFHETLGVTHRSRAPISGEWELTDGVSHAFHFPALPLLLPTEATSGLV